MPTFRVLLERDPLHLDVEAKTWSHAFDVAERQANDENDGRWTAVETTQIGED